MKKEEMIANKNYLIMQVLDRWVDCYQKQLAIEDFFLINGYKNIAIYGMGMLGKRLYKELKSTDIEIRYCIDKFCDAVDIECSIYRETENLPMVDAIVCTVVQGWEQIVVELSRQVPCEIIPIQDIFLINRKFGEE